MLKNKCCLYVIISIRFFSITICNLLIESPPVIEGAFVDKKELWRYQDARYNDKNFWNTFEDSPSVRQCEKENQQKKCYIFVGIVG